MNKSYKLWCCWYNVKEYDIKLGPYYSSMLNCREGTLFSFSKLLSKTYNYCKIGLKTHHPPFVLEICVVFLQHSLCFLLEPSQNNNVQKTIHFASIIDDFNCSGLFVCKPCAHKSNCHSFQIINF